jgi:hypothetical protein
MIPMLFWQEQHHFSLETQEENRNLQKIFNLRLTALIETGIKRGDFYVDNPRLAAFALFGQAQWIPRWYRPDGEFEINEIAAYFSEQALRIVGFQVASSLNRAVAT